MVWFVHIIKKREIAKTTKKKLQTCASATCFNLFDNESIKTQGKQTKIIIELSKEQINEQRDSNQPN